MRETREDRSRNENGRKKTWRDGQEYEGLRTSGNMLYEKLLGMEGKGRKRKQKEFKSCVQNNTKYSLPEVAEAVVINMWTRGEREVGGS